MRRLVVWVLVSVNRKLHRSDRTVRLADGQGKASTKRDSVDSVELLCRPLMAKVHD